MRPISAPCLGHPSLLQQHHRAPAQPDPHTASVDDLGSPLLHGPASHASRAASAPSARMLLGSSGVCTSQSALQREGPAGFRPTARHTFHAAPKVVGSQLAAHYLQEAAHQLQGLQCGAVAAPIHAMSHVTKQPLSATTSTPAAPAIGAEPPAVLTAGVTPSGWLVPDARTHGGQSKSSLQPDQCLSLPSAELAGAQPFRVGHRLAACASPVGDLFCIPLSTCSTQTCKVVVTVQLHARFNSVLRPDFLAPRASVSAAWLPTGCHSVLNALLWGH